MKEYAGKSKAFFIEGAAFKTIVSLPDGKAMVINDTVNDTVKQRMTRVIQELIKQPGLKSKDLAKLTGYQRFRYAEICKNLRNW